MNTSKTNLKKYAGLLNDVAPDNHFLAYITPEEKNLLVDAGGVKTPTPSGIFAYPPLGQPGTSPGTTSSGGFSGGRGGGGDRQQYSAKQTVSKPKPKPKPTVTVGGGGGRDIIPVTPKVITPKKKPTPVSGDDLEEGQDTAVGADFTPTKTKTVADVVTDYVKSGGIIGATLRGIGGLLGVTKTPNKYEGITGEDGYGEGDYISTLDDFAESRGLGDDYSSLDLEDQQFIDKEAYNAGYRSPAFQRLYEGGDASTQNLSQLSSAEREAVNKAIPTASYIVSGFTPQQSMVNQYFANLGMSGQSPLSSKLETDYNTAKQSINSLLGIVPPSQQFGYSSDPYGGLLATNLTTNPFNIPYLQQRGLI